MALISQCLLSANKYSFLFCCIHDETAYILYSSRTIIFFLQGNKVLDASDSKLRESYFPNFHEHLCHMQVVCAVDVKIIFICISVYM